MSAAAFGLTVLITALAGVAAVLSSRVSERLRIPAPAFFLIAAAAAADVWPRLGGLSFTAVEQIVSVALAVILFDRRGRAERAIHRALPERASAGCVARDGPGQGLWEHPGPPGRAGRRRRREGGGW